MPHWQGAMSNNPELNARIEQGTLLHNSLLEAHSSEEKG
jgi:hypothetical protein